MDERRRLTAMVLLFAIGFGLVALASAVSSVWPLFLTPIPYATIAWLVVQGDDEDLAAMRPASDEGPIDRGARDRTP